MESIPSLLHIEAPDAQGSCKDRPLSDAAIEQMARERKRFRAGTREG